jgi:mono/diheme cytochrome c family protein
MSKALPVAALAFLVLLATGCQYERMTHTPSVRPYERVMPGTAPGAVPTDGGEAAYRLAPAGTLASPFPSTPASIARGKLAYGYFCVQCHGAKYNGEGTVGQSFSPLPTDLRSDLVQSYRSDDELFRAISYGAGIDPVLNVPRHPPLAYTVSAEDRWHLIHWIRSLGVRPAGETAESGGFGEITEFFHRPGVASGPASR